MPSLRLLGRRANTTPTKDPMAAASRGNSVSVPPVRRMKKSPINMLKAKETDE